MIYLRENATYPELFLITRGRVYVLFSVKKVYICTLHGNRINDDLRLSRKK